MRGEWCPIWLCNGAGRLPVPSACSSRRAISVSQLAGMQLRRKATIDEWAGHLHLAPTCSCTCDPLVLLPCDDRALESGEGALRFRPDQEPNLGPRLPQWLTSPLAASRDMAEPSRLILWPLHNEMRGEVDAFSKTQPNWFCLVIGGTHQPEVGVAHSGGPLAASLRSARQWQCSRRQSTITQAPRIDLSTLSKSRMDGILRGGSTPYDVVDDVWASSWVWSFLTMKTSNTRSPLQVFKGLRALPWASLHMPPAR